MALFVSITYLICTLIFSYKEKTRKNILFTPAFAYNFPLSLIMVMVSFIDLMGFDSDNMTFYVPAISFFVGITVFFIGQYFRKKYYNKQIFDLEKQNFNSKDKYIKLLYKGIEYFIYATIVIYILMYIYKFGIRLPKNFNELKFYFGNHSVGHLINYSTAFVVVIFAKNYNKSFKYKLKVISLAFIWTVILLFSNSKYYILMFAVSIIFVILYYGHKNIFVKAGILFISSASLFFIVYMLRAIALGDGIDLKFIFNHFYYYLSSGFYAFSKSLITHPKPTIGLGVAFAPIMNVFNKILGLPIASSTSQFIDVKIGDYTHTNVYTLFGVYNLEVGFLLSMLLVCLLFVFVYKIYYSKYLTPIKIGFICYLLSTIFFAYFNSFYGTMNVWEIIIIYIFISCFERQRIIKLNGNMNKESKINVLHVREK